MKEEIAVKESMTARIMLTLAIIAIIGLVMIFAPIGTPFWPLNVADIVMMLLRLMLVALFIERTVEVIIIILRDRRKTALKAELNENITRSREAVKSEIKNNKEAASMFKLMAGPDPRKGAEVFKMIDDVRTIEDKELEIQSTYAKFGAETATIAMRWGLVLGIVVSALGVRAVQPLLDPAILNGLTKTQLAFFSGIDVLVTGTLLGGGSKGIHSIIEAIINSVEKYRGWVK